MTLLALPPFDEGVMCTANCNYFGTSNPCTGVRQEDCKNINGSPHPSHVDEGVMCTSVTIMDEARKRKLKKRHLEL